MTPRSRSQAVRPTSPTTAGGEQDRAHQPAMVGDEEPGQAVDHVPHARRHEQDAEGARDVPRPVEQEPQRQQVDAEEDEERAGSPR